MDLPDDLQAKLDEYNKNFEALDTFLGDESLINNGATAELRVEKTKEMLTMAVPVGVRTLVELCVHAQSESVRLKASIYLIDRTLGKDALLAEEDQATQLLRRLQTGG